MTMQVMDVMKCLVRFLGSGEEAVVEQAGMWRDRQAWLQATKEGAPPAGGEEVKGKKMEERNSRPAGNLDEIRRKKVFIEEKKKKRFEDTKNLKDSEENRLNEEYWRKVEEERLAEEGTNIKPKQSFAKPHLSTYKFKQSTNQSKQSTNQPKQSTYKPQQNVIQSEPSTKPLQDATKPLQNATKPQQSISQHEAIKPFHGDSKPPHGESKPSFLASALPSPVGPQARRGLGGLARHRGMEDIRVQLQVLQLKF